MNQVRLSSLSIMIMLVGVIAIMGIQSAESASSSNANMTMSDNVTASHPSNANITMSDNVTASHPSNANMTMSDNVTATHISNATAPSMTNKTTSMTNATMPSMTNKTTSMTNATVPSAMPEAEIKKQVSDFLVNAIPLFQQQRAETLQEIRDCQQQKQNASPENLAQVNDQCHMKLNDIKAKYKDSRAELQTLIKSHRSITIPMLSSQLPKIYSAVSASEMMKINTSPPMEKPKHEKSIPAMPSSKETPSYSGFGNSTGK